MRIAATALVGVWLIGVAGGALAQAPGSEQRASNGADTVPADAATVVTTDGEATLKLCRDWLIRHDCREYGHVDIPTRIAVGDKFDVTFGSNPKTMQFRVKSVMARGDAGGCLLIPAHEDMPKTPSEDVPADMLIVKGCTVVR